MGVSDHQSQTSEKEFDISRCIQSAIRRNGKFKWNCKDIAYPAMNVSLSKLEPCVKDSYNYHLCGTVKFKKADEGFIESPFFTFEGYALLENEEVKELSDMICTKEHR
jgi:hypothetical protein